MTKPIDRSGARWIREEKLRTAEVAYITDRQKRSLEFWWEQICSSVVALSSFTHRARIQRWAPRRDEFWREAQEEVLRQSKYRAVHDRVSELQEIQQLRADALEAIKPRIINGHKIYPVKPNSLEGMIAAFAKLDQLADSKRDAVLTMIEPELSSDERDKLHSTFEPDEIRMVTRALLLERQRKQRERLLPAGGSDGEDVDPEAGEEAPDAG